MKNILIVDDQKTILITLEAILKPQGYTVFSCTNSIDAFDRFNNEHIDLVITDAIMPLGSNGYTLIASMRSSTKNPHIPIIMLTGKREKADVEKALIVGADDYLIKPIDPDILLTKVKNLLEKTAIKNEFVEAPVKAAAQIVTKTEIVSISEVSISLMTNIQPSPGQLYKIQSDFLRQFDLENINIRVSEIKPINEALNQFKITGFFVGLSDKELGQIRIWVRKKLTNSA